MDVNAGMDIVAVRKKYPKLKFIGAFNKLEIAKGRESIDKEFERDEPHPLGKRSSSIFRPWRYEFREYLENNNFKEKDLPSLWYELRAFC